MVGKDTEPQARELNVNQQLEWCFGNLGDRITAATLSPDVPDAYVVGGWIYGDVPAPVGPKISMLYGAATRISEVYDIQTARAFLRSLNPSAGDESILTIIGHLSPEEAQPIVETAVEAFLG